MLLRQCQVWTRGPGHCLVWVSVSAQPLCVNDNSGSDQALTQTPHLERQYFYKHTIHPTIIASWFMEPKSKWSNGPIIHQLFLNRYLPYRLKLMSGTGFFLLNIGGNKIPLKLNVKGSSLTSWLTPGKVYETSRENPEIGSVMGWSTTRHHITFFEL